MNILEHIFNCYVVGVLLSAVKYTNIQNYIEVIESENLCNNKR